MTRMICNRLQSRDRSSAIVCTEALPEPSRAMVTFSHATRSAARNRTSPTPPRRHENHRRLLAGAPADQPDVDDPGRRDRGWRRPELSATSVAPPDKSRSATGSPGSSSPTPMSTSGSRRSPGNRPGRRRRELADWQSDHKRAGRGGTGAGRLPQQLRATGARRLGDSGIWRRATSCTARATAAGRGRAIRATGDRDVAARSQPVRRSALQDVRAGRREGIDGHPMIEMALVDLYRETGTSSYLDLASYFVEARGPGLLDPPGHHGPAYFQDHLPVRDVRTLAGHAVRALYLAAGATDVAVETGDTALLDALRAPWQTMARESDVSDRRRSGRGGTARRSATRSSCRRTRRTARPARRSPACSGAGGCCSRPARAVRRPDRADAVQRGDLGRLAERSRASSTSTR